MVGDTIYIKKRTVVGHDDFNAPIYEYQDIQVDNVLIEPGKRADVIESNRPEGVEVKLTLHLPKVFTGGDFVDMFGSSIANLSVVVYGIEYKVIGDPKPYQVQNTPTAWNMPVEVGVVDG